ncbi:hypothetical protein [Cryobacterium cryoconiti]|uniref:Uncharacterized protein n=1 Tax=Cryobacterium cryoconiti TaxID=1259239 RepID=A0A4Y8JXT0_9MICO|nr:hypothetical protein [Cryobacterium cryoconiti]TFD31143.1 hypothetical protein E3T49_06375 [Cryobacterium cryoconiti]
MRWDNLFDDLEGQLEHELNTEEIDLRAEEERLRLGRLSLRNRLTSLVQTPAGPARGAAAGVRSDTGVLRIVLAMGETITVRPTTFGRDWLAGDLLDSGAAGSQCVLPLAAIAGVVLRREEVSGSLGIEPESAARVVDRIGLAFVLRDLCRRRASVEVHTRAGVLPGTIDRVGRDHVDLALHAAGTLRREAEVRNYRIVPVAEIQLVRLP